MTHLALRQDEFSFSGTVISMWPPVPGPTGSEVLRWSIVVRPGPGQQAAATNQNGVLNPGGTVTCSVAIDPAVIVWGKLLTLFSGAIGRKVRVVGSLCDDLDAGSMAVIQPLGILAVEQDLEIYDVNGWPTPVRDFDVMAFANAAEAVFPSNDLHGGESRTLTARLPFPFRPSGAAQPFFRAYRTTKIDNADAVTFAVEEPAGRVELAVTVETGVPEHGKGFYAAQIGLTFDEPDLDNYCPPGTCEHDGAFCSHDGTFRYTRLPAHLPTAQTGDLLVSPGDGAGLISGIVASLVPAQVYDHMGIFIDNGWTIRHCTASSDRLEDDSLFTAEITLNLLGAVGVDTEKVPLNGLRPDLLRFGWPGSITQTVEEVFRNGRNSRNPRWGFAATHPGADAVDPENPAQPFRIYHLARSDRGRRLMFNDPERDKAEAVVRLQEASVVIAGKEYKPTLVRPHAELDASVRPALHDVVQICRKLNAHYRFFAYTRGDIGRDPASTVPAANDAFWGTLPQGARWASGTIPAMCSSFVWTAIQIANEQRPAHTFPIVLEDRVDAEDPAKGLEYGTKDGFYRYHEEERLQAANGLVNKLKAKIRSTFDDKISGAVYAFTPQLAAYRDVTAIRVANQTANAFATDSCESLDEKWMKPGEGESVSPDNVRDFWDLKPRDGIIRHPEGGLAAYGDTLAVQLAPPKWVRIPLFRKQDSDPGRGKVTGIAFVAGRATAGVTIRFDFGCETAMTTGNRETAFMVNLEAGTHFAEGFIDLPNPATGQVETFRTMRPLKFDVEAGNLSRIELYLDPPSDLWRIIDIHLDADIHDRSFWGGDADAHHFVIDRSFELRQDLEDEPDAPDDQRNTVLHHEEVWRTEPEVGSGVHIAVSFIADLDPADRSVKCHCEIALIDTDSGGFLGIGTSSDVDQIERRDVRISADGAVDVLKDVDFSSNETVPERARVSLQLKNRRRPT